MKLKLYFILLIVMFLSPIVFDQLLSTKPEESTTIIQKQDEPLIEKQIVYAGNFNDNILNPPPTQNKKALFLFTHSHEAFQPIVENQTGLTAVYHPTSNITNFKEVISTQFNINSISTDFIDFDTMSELKRLNRNFNEAYKVIRPKLENKLQNDKYDIVIDLHRDSSKRATTTLEFNNETYAKVYFVVGEEHKNYSENQKIAKHISNHMNELVPNISRGVIGKKGEHVDGIYNQDLYGSMVLIELGGIESTEEEVNRTISVLSKAISIVLNEELTS